MTGTVSIKTKKIDLPGLQTNPIRVEIDIAGMDWGVTGAWTESSKAPGNFKFP